MLSRWLPLLQLSCPSRTASPSRRKGGGRKGTKRPTFASYDSLIRESNLFQKSPIDFALFLVAQIWVTCQRYSNYGQKKQEASIMIDPGAGRITAPELLFRWTTHSVSHKKVILKWAYRNQGIWVKWKHTHFKKCKVDVCFIHELENKKQMYKKMYWEMLGREYTAHVCRMSVCLLRAGEHPGDEKRDKQAFIAMSLRNRIITSNWLVSQKSGGMPWVSAW